jgi:hypothetical protein
MQLQVGDQLLIPPAPVSATQPGAEQQTAPTTQPAADGDARLPETGLPMADGEPATTQPVNHAEYE